MKETEPAILKTEPPEFYSRQREENTEPREEKIGPSVFFYDVPEEKKQRSEFYSGASEGNAEALSLKEDWRKENIRRPSC